jgi:hypothetical protein
MPSRLSGSAVAGVGADDAIRAPRAAVARMMVRMTDSSLLFAARAAAKRLTTSPRQSLFRSIPRHMSSEQALRVARCSITVYRGKITRKGVGGQVGQSRIGRRKLSKCSGGDLHVPGSSGRNVPSFVD